MRLLILLTLVIYGLSDRSLALTPGNNSVPERDMKRPTVFSGVGTSPLPEPNVPPGHCKTDDGDVVDYFDCIRWCVSRSYINVKECDRGYCECEGMFHMSRRLRIEHQCWYYKILDVPPFN